LEQKGKVSLYKYLIELLKFFSTILKLLFIMTSINPYMRTLAIYPWNPDSD